MPLIPNSINDLPPTIDMPSPSRSPSPDSDNESAAHLRELKAQLEAETRAADAKKAWKEWKECEQRECEEREYKELQEELVVKDRDRAVHIRACLAEEAERLTGQLRGVWEAVAVVA